MSGQPKPKLRVFISHCCTSVRQDEEVLKEFIDALSPHATVLVDRRFSRHAEPGWRENVRDWISSCHIAISLLGTRASKRCVEAGHIPSEHIHDESHDLARRRDNQPAFNWLLVKLDTLEFSDFQATAGHRYANITKDALLPPREALERAINLVKTLSECCNADIPLRSFLIQAIKIVKDELQADPSVIADYFGYDPGFFSPADLIELARHRLTNEATKTLESALLIANKLKLTKQTRAKLAHCLCPLWIDHELAIQFKQHLDQKIACLLQSGQTYEVATRYTARWMLARAYQEVLDENKEVSGEKPGLLSPDNVVIVDTALANQADAEDLLREIEDSICAKLGIIDANELAQELNECEQNEEPPIVVLMPFAENKFNIAIETATRLNSQYPQLHFMVIPENSQVGHLISQGNNGPSFYKTTIDRFKEFESLRSYRKAVGETHFPIIRQEKP